MFTLGYLAPDDAFFINLLLLCLFATAGVVCGKIGSEKGYSFWLCLLLCLFGNMIGILLIILLPDIAQRDAQEQARIRYLDDEITALKQRITELEADRTVQAETTDGDMPVPSEPCPQFAPDAPVVFSARTEEIVACPRCGRRQRGDREFCYACQVPFRYENE